MSYMYIILSWMGWIWGILFVLLLAIGLIVKHRHKEARGFEVLPPQKRGGIDGAR